MIKCVREVIVMTHSMTIELPEAVYQSLSEEARQKGKKAEEIVVEIKAFL